MANHQGHGAFSSHALHKHVTTGQLDFEHFNFLHARPHSRYKYWIEGQVIAEKYVFNRCWPSYFKTNWNSGIKHFSIGKVNVWSFEQNDLRLNPLQSGRLSRQHRHDLDRLIPLPGGQCTRCGFFVERAESRRLASESKIRRIWSSKLGGHDRGYWARGGSLFVY